MDLDMFDLLPAWRSHSETLSRNHSRTGSFPTGSSPLQEQDVQRYMVGVKPSSNHSTTSLPHVGHSKLPI
jgi:hypothetical protein